MTDTTAVTITDVMRAQSIALGFLHACGGLHASQLPQYRIPHMERTLHIRKFANAFSTSTKIKPSFSEVPVVGDFAIDAVERYKIKHGGAWVGGSVEITGNGICFTENATNRAINSHPLTVHIAMLDILSVHREFGWVTGIIVVYHREGEFRFRCFGAKTVAKRLSAYLAAC